MQNDMMIAALNSQKAGKMPPVSTPEVVEEKPQGIEDRLSALEDKYEELCKIVGMDDKTPKEAPRGY
jgi:hypothetical protein